VTPEAEESLPVVAEVAVRDRHSRREWLALGERIFSHPRYGLLILIGLLLCFFDRILAVQLLVTLLFSLELGFRYLYHRETGWREPLQRLLMLFDLLAVLGLLAVLAIHLTHLDFERDRLLELILILRGFYLLRLFRLFAQVTHDTVVHSMPYAAVVLAGAFVAVLSAALAPYVAIALLLELVVRSLAIARVRMARHTTAIEYLFVGFDLAITLPLFFHSESWPHWLVLLRALRVLAMLNPQGNLLLAMRQALLIPELRREMRILLSMFVIFVFLVALSLLLLFPRMDLSGDGTIDGADYSLHQVLLYAVQWLIDPGVSPRTAFSPAHGLLIVSIVLTGVFFFALLVGFGSNLMHSLLHELTNSPLNARVPLLFAGHNDKAAAILEVYGQMSRRVRRVRQAVWLHFDESSRPHKRIGSWLDVRSSAPGARNILARFKLTGVRQSFIFHRDPEAREAMGEVHSLLCEAGQMGQRPGATLISESAPTGAVEKVYRQALGVRQVNSAEIAARMLYQMHHCRLMPDLGMRLLDSVGEDTGLHTVAVAGRLAIGEHGMHLHLDGRELLLEAWAVECFAHGVNVLALRDGDGTFHLLPSLLRRRRDLAFTDVVAVGRDIALWPQLFAQAMQGVSTMEPEQPALRRFELPESWELNMLFLGWHEGLPAMVEEMAENHHSLTVNILSPLSDSHLRLLRERLEAVAQRVQGDGRCRLQLHLHAWDGLDLEAVLPHLRSCKVIMLYPMQDGVGGEDTRLELWFHSLAQLLSERKANVRWWTPPKLMVLPRRRAAMPAFHRATRDYPLLRIDVGSPDLFHDCFMARLILATVARDEAPQWAAQEEKNFEFVRQLLGDTFIVESEETPKLLARPDADWRQFYREGLRRGWVMVGYLLPDPEMGRWRPYAWLDALFAERQALGERRLMLLGGSFVADYEPPVQCSQLLLLHRGTLERQEEADETQPFANDERGEGNDLASMMLMGGATADDALPMGMSAFTGMDATAPGLPPEEPALEVEVMDVTWPNRADPKLLRVLQRQIEGAVQLLNESTEQGLHSLAEAMEKHPEVENEVMEALHKLQNVDRVMQRLNNVKSCLDEWAVAMAAAPSDPERWRTAVEKRYVMEEERQVLRSET